MRPLRRAIDPLEADGPRPAGRRPRPRPDDSDAFAPARPPAPDPQGAPRSRPLGSAARLQPPFFVAFTAAFAIGCSGPGSSATLATAPPSEARSTPAPPFEPDAPSETSAPDHPASSAPADPTALAADPTALPAGPFRVELAPGFVFSAYVAPDPRPDAAVAPADALGDTDPRLFVLTVDPARYEVVLASMRDPAGDGNARSADAWARDLNLLAAWNPGMFEPDGASTGYTRTPAFTSQGNVRRAPLYSSFFVATDGRVDVLHERPPAAPGAYVALDALSPAFVERLGGHAIVSQSLTVLRDGRAAYPATRKQWSELAYGVDDRGHLAVVFTRWPYELRDLGQRLEKLGIGLRHLAHGEGGPEATLVVTGAGFVGVGSYESGFFGAGNDTAWRLPAVMGVRSKSP